MIRTTRIVTCVVAIAAIFPIYCPAGDITFDFDFRVDPNSSYSSGYMNVMTNTGPGYKHDLKDINQPDSTPRTPDQYLLSPKQWGMEIPLTSLPLGEVYSRGQTHGFLEWQDPCIHFDFLAKAAQIADVYSYCSFSSYLSGIATTQLGSSVYPDGVPVYLMTLFVPGQSGATDSGFAIDGPYQRKGPEWSGILDSNFGEIRKIFQIGDTQEFDLYLGASTLLTDLGTTSSSVSLDGRYEFHARKPEAGEISRNSLVEKGIERVQYTQDRGHGHVCIHAAVAMILDYWGHYKLYSELHQNTQQDYYAALDKVMGTGAQKPYQAVAAMNDYFAARNGCRTGKPVSLRAVGPKQLSELTIEKMRHPFIILGSQIEDNGQFMLTDKAVGHAFVVDAYYGIQTNPSPSRNSQLMTWLAVRDTWDTALTPVVSVPIGGNPKYRSFEDEGREWWPLDYRAYDALWFPGTPYRCRPAHFIEVEETFPFGDSQNEVKTSDLSDDDFDRVIVPQLTPPLLPEELWQQYRLMSNVRILPDDARVLPSLVVGPPDESLAYGYMLRVQLQQPVTAEVALTCYSTRKVIVEFDYAYTAGTLQLYGNNALLASIPKTPSTALVPYERTFTLAGEGTTTFALRLTGAAGNELYLDNLWLTNPVAEQIQPDLDGNRRVDQADFARIAARWLKRGCTAPDFCAGADINHSGIVDIVDLFLFIDSWMLDERNPDFAVEGNADLDMNFRVDLADFTRLAGQWKRSPCYFPDFCLGADIDQSGTVDLHDLAVFASYWMDEMF
jgi:hypothetical protein